MCDPEGTSHVGNTADQWVVILEEQNTFENFPFSRNQVSIASNETQYFTSENWVQIKNVGWHNDDKNHPVVLMHEANLQIEKLKSIWFPLQGTWQSIFYSQVTNFWYTLWRKNCNQHISRSAGFIFRKIQTPFSPSGNLVPESSRLREVFRKLNDVLQWAENWWATSEKENKQVFWRVSGLIIQTNQTNMQL